MPIDNDVEWLRYEFTDQKENSAIIALQWEKLISIPFKVDVDYEKTQLASFRRELVGEKAFNWQNWMQAAQWCAQRNADLDEGLAWANKAIDPNMGGTRNFQTLSTKAQILSLQGKTADADALMKEAMPLGTVGEVIRCPAAVKCEADPGGFCGIQRGLNYRHPNEFTTNMGLARGYSATGDYKKHWTMKKAQGQAPDQANKDNVGRLIPTLEEGKDIN